VDRARAEALYDSGKEPTVVKLLELHERIQALEKAVATTKLDSTNSSKPPSTDGPRVQRPQKPRSPRKPGGQPGRQGKNRSLLPTDQMDQVHELFAERCAGCGGKLDPDHHPQSSPPARYQYFELPEIEPIKHEYRLHELKCPCGRRTRAELPPAVAASSFGPRVHAFIAILSSYRISRRGVGDLLETLFGLTISLGAVDSVTRRVSSALEAPTEQIHEKIIHSATLNVDETGWKCKGQKRWLWVFVSSFAVLFHISMKRSSRTLREVLGETFAGIMVSDDFSAYVKYCKAGLRQLCWAHIIRKIKGLKDTRGSPDAQKFSKAMLKEIGNLFRVWHAFLANAVTREELPHTCQLVRARIKRLCNHYRNSTDEEVRTRARSLLKNWDHLFTFLYRDDVEPTNNSAERSLRPAVQSRKLCFGNQSAEGERFTERLLSVTATCRLQKLNACEFITRCVTSYLNAQPIPSLF
jgi:transposase